MLDSIDSGLMIYMSTAAMVVVAAFVIFGLFTESVRAVHQQAVEDDKRKKKQAQDAEKK